MEWQFDFHKSALKFIEINKISQSEIINIIAKVIKKFEGEDININIVKLKGIWFGFYRIRVGKIRIIAEFNFNNRLVYIEKIDWRGNAYK